MAEQVTLSAAVRSSLLSLQSTTKLIDRTQGRLASGLKIAGPVDDPVAFFQAKSLNDRAFDFNEKKDGIDQGISAVTAALDGVDSIETLVRQIKGVANSMKSAEATQMSNLITQFNDLRTQINNLAADSTFQGTNLINGTGTTLTIEFSEKSASVLNIASTDITVGTAGLSIGQTVAFTGQFDGDVATAAVNTVSFSADSGSTQNNFKAGFTAGTFTLTYEGGNFTYTTADSLLFTYGTNVLTVSVGGTNTVNKEDVLVITVSTGGNAGNTGFYLQGDTLNFATIYGGTGLVNINAGTAFAGGDDVTFTWNGQTTTFTTADNGTTFSFADVNMLLTVCANDTITLTNGAAFVMNFNSGANETAQASVINASYSGASFTAAFDIEVAAMTATETKLVINGIKASTDVVAGALNFIEYVQAGDTVALNDTIKTLDSALTTLRTQAQNLGTNVAVLQTRLDFTESYVNTLEIGAAKLTLADLNEEGANLLALQTRQQLGIQALAFAGQAEQSILALFR